MLGPLAMAIGVIPEGGHFLVPGQLGSLPYGVGYVSGLNHCNGDV